MEGSKKCFMCDQQISMDVLVSSRFVCEDCLTVMTKNELVCCLDCDSALKTTSNNTEEVLTCLCQDANTSNCEERPFLEGDVRDRFLNVPAPMKERKMPGEQCYYSGKWYASEPNLTRLVNSGNPVPNSNTKMKFNEPVGQTEKPTGLCAKHDMEETKFYCQTCTIRICRDCAILDHRDHKFVYNKTQRRIDANERLHERLKTLLEYAEEKQIVLNEKLQNLDSRLEKKSKEIEEAKMKIRSRTVRMKELISEQEDILLSCLDSHIQRLTKNVKSQKSELKSALEDVNHGLEIAQEMFRKNIPRATRQLPNGFTKNHGMSDQVNSTGHVKSNAVGQVNGVSMENYELENPLEKSLSQFESEADFCDHEIDDDDDSYLRIDEETNKNNAFDLNFPGWKSDSKLLNHATFVNEDNIKSPLPKNPTFDFVRSLGEQGDSDGKFLEPVGVTAAPDGTIFVADYNNDRLQLFDKKGNFLRTMTQVTTAKGRSVPFLCPTGLATDRSGNIVVAERGRHRITVISPEGKLQHKFGKLGKARGQFRDPHGVSVDNRGRIIVADTTNNRIQVFDKNGDMIFTFGNKGDHVLDYPNYAIFHKGLFIVSDTDNDSVKIFDKEGQFLRKLSDAEKEGESFSAPSGLAIYRDEYILVCDFNNDCVKMFSLDGEFVTTIGCEGTGPGEFSGPEALTVTSDDNIIVTDKNNGRVQVFELHSESKSPSTVS